MKATEKIDKYLNEASLFNSKGIQDQIEMFYNNWGGEILAFTDSMKGGASVAKVQGLLAQADKHYKKFIESMRAAETRARKG